MWGKIGFEFDWWDLCKSYSVRDGCVLSGCCCGSRSVSLPDFYLIFLSSAIPLYFFCPFQISLSSPVLFPLGGLLFAVLSPSLSVHLPFILQSLLPRFSPGLPLPACPSLSACMTAPLPTFFILPLKYPYVSPALTTSLGVDEGGEGLLLSQSRTDTWVKPGRTTLKITWWSDSPLQPSVPSLILPLMCVTPGLRAELHWM